MKTIEEKIAMLEEELTKRDKESIISTIISEIDNRNIEDYLWMFGIQISNDED